MTDMPTTPRLALPLLAVSQAQKEVTHNEALTLLDALLHAAVEAGPLAAPPASPVTGQCWLVDAVPTGAWAGNSHAIAIWTRRSRVDAGWRDHVDLPHGESREAWHVALSPPVAGVGPWERTSPSLTISAGDLALSPPLSLPLT
ncbi:MAG: DUF2793 domain-containing protein [Sphingopyxis sp.]|uniref:DUF2793 domain-containing protein n=1 Tax=Sphingopyxis sp. TaxID=1908224 RepID=UPI001A30C1F7|nr:DUF2793 domain-containing protein [Sphingopyxis sp.]MBJ7501800.1 DUF2793 domain-containing protein [Sphingopyxis sp.]